MHYTYKTSQLVCSSQIDIDIDNGVITNVAFTGGCPGNLTAIGILVKGKTPQEVIDKLEGVDCGGKGTSCTDQLAKALKEILAGRLS